MGDPARYGLSARDREKSREIGALRRSVLLKDQKIERLERENKALRKRVREALAAAQQQEMLLG
jgi:uncharacterized protein (UPF0335 family)